VALLAVDLFAVTFFSVVFLAVVFFAAIFFAVVFVAAVFFAVVLFAVVLRAAGFPGVLFAVVLVPFLLAGMAASLVTFTLGATCLGDHPRRGDAPSATVIAAAEAACSDRSSSWLRGRPPSSGRLVFAALPPSRWSHPSHGT
jgi:hypothetical protein